MKFFNTPFNHWVLDDFLDLGLAKTLSNEFLDYNNPNWFCYNNPLEHKKTLNNWYFFPNVTYQFINYLNSNKFLSFLSKKTNIANLYHDPGLHGAGWHIHGRGGKLNVHFDYSIHPKLKLQRKLNIIIYLTEAWDPSWGGGLQFWSHDQLNNKPLAKVKTIEFKFNRAVLFDTTQHSWHGFPDPLACPENVYRKSIAMYYLCDPPEDVDQRTRALYSPSPNQENDPQILEMIKNRSL